MPRLLRHLASGLGLALALSTLLTACGGDQNDAAPAEEAKLLPTATRPLRIVATTPLLADLVVSIAQDLVEVTSLIPAGRSPHRYQPDERGLALLKTADLVISHGLDFESGLQSALNGLPASVTWLAVGDSIPANRILTTHGAANPHVWFDTHLWGICARVVSDELSRLDPAHRPNYGRTLISYRRGLDTLRRWVSNMLAAVPRDQRVVVTPHAALAYLGEAFDLETHGLEGSDLSPDDLAALVVERGVPVVFGEVDGPADGIDGFVAAVSARGGSVAVAGPLLLDMLDETRGGANSHLGLFRHDVLAIAEGLTGKTRE